MTFFGGLEFILNKPLSAEDKNFQSLITRHLVHFAKTGPDTSCLLNGSTSVLTNEDEGKALTNDCWHSSFVFLAGKMEAEWPEYPSATALLSDRLSVDHNYSAEQCRLWKENGLYAYAWMNWARTDFGVTRPASQTFLHLSTMKVDGIYLEMIQIIHKPSSGLFYNQKLKIKLTWSYMPLCLVFEGSPAVSMFDLLCADELKLDHFIHSINFIWTILHVILILMQVIFVLLQNYSL